jgi:arylsulfatase
MRWPGHLPANSVCKEPLVTIDIFPTLARLIGAELPEHKIDGLDVWPILADLPGAKNPHEAYYFYYNRNDLQAVRSGEWKLLFAHTSRTMNGQEPGQDGLPGKYRPLAVEPSLYNLTTDPGETKDVSENNPDVVKRLKSLAENIRADLGDDLTKQPATGARPSGK